MIINSEQPVACVSACVSRHTRLSRETDSERERETCACSIQTSVYHSVKTYKLVRA